MGRELVKMVTVTRMSLRHIFTFNNAKQKSLPFNIGELLEKYLQYYTNNSEHIHAHYSSVAVMIQVDNCVDWDKQQHEQFCKYFDLILVKVIRQETFQARRYQVEMSYLYTPSFMLEKYNEFCKVNLDDVW